MKRYNAHGYSSDILQYNISSDSIEKVSSLSLRTDGGVVLKGKDNKYVYYFGGSMTDKVIHRFNPATKVTVKLSAVLPSEVMYGAGVSINQSAFIFNGRGGNVLEFKFDTETVDIVADLSFRNGTVLTTASIPDSNSSRVCLFPGSDEKLMHKLLIFNTESKLISTVDYNVSVPPLFLKPATVWTGRYGYIIGGFGKIAESGGITHPSNGILR
jgi:hypothetical protein